MSYINKPSSEGDDPVSGKWKRGKGEEGVSEEVLVVGRCRW